MGTVCLENRNPGRGAGRGAPSPPQSASCPSRLPPCDTQAGRRARGCRGGGGLQHEVPTPPVAQPPARGYALWGGRGGVKLLQGPTRAGREGESPVEEARRGAGRRGGEGAGRRGAGPWRGERAGAAAAARPAGGSARRWQGAGSVLRVPRVSERARARGRGMEHRGRGPLGSPRGRPAETAGGWGICGPGPG